MKKFLVSGLMLFSIISIGQTSKDYKVIESKKPITNFETPKSPKSERYEVKKDSIYLKKIVDEMAGKTYILVSKNLVLTNEEKNKGFRIQPNVKDNLELSDLIVTTFKIGNCSEHDEMIILFEDGTKITKVSWKDFNCEGLSYIRLSDNDVENLTTKPISKIRMTNKRSFESWTSDLQGDEKQYFIQLFQAIKTKNIVVSNK